MVVGSSPDCSSRMDSADTAGTCDVGAHAAGDAGAVDTDVGAHDNHSTRPK